MLVLKTVVNVVLVATFVPGEKSARLLGMQGLEIPTLSKVDILRDF